MRHFGTFLNPQVASTVGYKQLYDKYATNAREEKDNFEKVSSYYPAWVPVYVQELAKLFLPLIGWLAETDLTFLKVLRFSFPVPLEKNEG